MVMRALPIAGCCLLALLACGSPGASPAVGDEADLTAIVAGAPELAGLGDGYAVWESNRAASGRTGDWRIWTRRLDGSGLRQLSPDEAGLQHCCPHVSPDGARVAYLSRAAGKDRYPEREVAGDLRLAAISGDGERTVGLARTYGWGNRSAVWVDDHQLVHVGGDGRTLLLEVDSGRSRPLTREPRDELGWLIDPTLRFATSADPSFAPYDADRLQVLPRRSLGGCEPYFSADGRWGFWVAGGGGPIYRIDLRSREVAILLRKNDERMTAGQGYLYFPMLSRDGRLFAFGASAGEHDHFRANYDVYVAPADPRTLEIVGKPLRLTSHPASDRYPDVFLASPGPALVAAEVPPGAEPGAESETADLPGPPGGAVGSPWPSDRRDLTFLWQTADRPNLVYDPELEGDVADPLAPRGRAGLDHDWAMVLAGGSMRAPEETAARLLAAIQGRNELTLEATITAARLPGDEVGWIVDFAGRRQHNLALGQEGRSLVLRLRAGPDRTRVRLFDLPVEPVHVAVTYSPGFLAVYRDGEPVVIDTEVRGARPGAARPRGALGGWKPGELTFGDGWPGTLEGVAIYARVLAAAEVAENARRYLELRQERPPVPHLEVRARLRAKSVLPTLDQISPYRQALAVYEYAVDEVLAGDYDRTLVRVAHWVILDGETLDVAGANPGDPARLVLEPFGSNPQLESHYLSATLEGVGLPLFYEVSP